MRFWLNRVIPQITATVSRYLSQIGCVLRPGRVADADLAPRCFAGFLVETAPEVASIAQVTRRQIDEYEPWLGRSLARRKT